MSVALHHWTAALYLCAGLVAWLGLGLRLARLEELALSLLAAGAIGHLAALAFLHELDPPVALTDLGAAASFMACVGVFFFLMLARIWRLASLTALVAPLGFVCVFSAALGLGSGPPPAAGDSGSLPHLHVLLASAGLACLGVSGLAGLIFLVEDRRLRAHRPIDARFALPSLEALDRVNRVSLTVGFPLLTLGLVAGFVWVASVHGTPFRGSPHEVASLAGWLVYAGIVAARFGASQGARRAALSAVAGFAVLCVAVIGVGLMA